MSQKFRKGVSERKSALVDYFAANPDAQLCDECIRSILKCQRSTLTEKDIRESALEAGLLKKWGVCLQCQKDRFVIARR